MADTATGTIRLRDLYLAEIRDGLQAELGLANVMQVPKLEKIVVNMGVGDAAQQAKLLDGALVDLELIAGQKPLVTRAKRSVSNFRLREGQAIGAKVTLRGNTTRVRCAFSADSQSLIAVTFSGFWYRYEIPPEGGACKLVEEKSLNEFNDVDFVGLVGAEDVE